MSVPEKWSGRGSVLNGWYSFPRKALSPAELHTHNNALKLPIVSTFKNSLPYYLQDAGPQTRDLFKDNDPDYWGCPVIYGLNTFGAPDEDKRQDGEPLGPDVKFTGKIWGPDAPFNQEPVFETVTKHLSDKRHGCTFTLPTGTGKTGMALALIAHLGRKALFCEFSVDLIDQVEKEIKKFMPGAKVGRIHCERCDPKHHKDLDIVLASVPTLLSRRYSRELFEPFGVVILDEVHHAVAEKTSELLFPMLAHIRYMIGISATPERPDDMHKVLGFWVGPEVFHAPAATKASEQTVVRVLRYTRGKHLVVYAPRDPRGRRPVDLKKTFDKLVTDPERNRFLLDAISTLVKEGRRILIISERVMHSKNMIEQLKARFPSKKFAHFVSGQSAAAKAVRAEVLRVPHDAIAGTVQACGEGKNLVWLDTVFLATSKRSRREVMQACGRIRENRESPHSALVVDVFDDHAPFIGQYKDRKKTYREKKYQIVETWKSSE